MNNVVKGPGTSAVPKGENFIDNGFWKTLGIITGNLPPKWQAGFKDYTDNSYKIAKLMSRTARFTTPMIAGFGLVSLLLKEKHGIDIDPSLFNFITYTSPFIMVDTLLKEFSLQCSAKYFGPPKSKDFENEILNQPYGSFTLSIIDSKKNPNWYKKNS